MNIDQPEQVIDHRETGHGPRVTGLPVLRATDLLMVTDQDHRVTDLPVLKETDLLMETDRDHRVAVTADRRDREPADLRVRVVEDHRAAAGHRVEEDLRVRAEI